MEFIAVLPEGSPPAATHSEVNCDSSMNIARTKLAAELTSAQHGRTLQRPMLGLKHFRQAATTIAGIELMHRIRKGQFKLGKMGAKGNTAPKIWNAVLAAI